MNIKAAGPRRVGDPSTPVASYRKVFEVLGWQPQHDDLEFVVRTAWEQRLHACGGPETFGTLAPPSGRPAAG